MAINFPSSPVEGQVHNHAPGQSFVYRGISWQHAPIRTALPKNYVVNPSMQISQQNGDAASTALNYYMADQWFGESPAPNLTWSRGGAGPSGSQYIYGYVSTAIPSLSAANTLSFQTRIEGQRIADLKWGTADARQVIVRFWLAATKAGNYCVALRNGNAAGQRTYLAPFSVAANVWTDIQLVIPGDTGGAWLTDNSPGLQLVITFATGTTFQGVAGWQAGSFRALATTTNGLDTVGNTFHIADVCLYADPYKTGIVPPFKLPTYDQELRRCQRYWYRLFGLRGGMTTSATYISEMGGVKHPAPMRTQPAAAIIGTVSTWDGSGGAQMTSIGYTGNELEAGGNVNTTAGHVAGRAAVQYYSDDNNYIAISARM